jgi:hypothetical protein
VSARFVQLAALREFTAGGTLIDVLYALDSDGRVWRRATTGDGTWNLQLQVRENRGPGDL